MCEILAPAGDEQTAYAALRAGADAVYLGLSLFSARENAGIPTEALARVARYAHLLGAKVYVCLNTLVTDAETEPFFSFARAAWDSGADALLLQDIFLGKALKTAYPELVLHLSTQGGCCNVYGALLAKEYGFSRVVLARETPLSEIGKISEIIETEVFVQGALCTCFSGQCYLSSFAGNNSGNRGRCKQPCRKKYSIDRQGFGEFAYALSLSDLCVGDRIFDLLSAGVASLKIEGRMRRPEYCAAAVKYYRALLEGREGKEEFSRLKRAYNRGDYTKGLAFGRKDLLSRGVQGHIGEEIGCIVSVKDGFFCRSGFPAKRGDGFKILRGGKEVGGGSFLKEGKGGFFLSSSDRLKPGDAVRITTDTAANARSLAGERKRSVPVKLTFLAGKRARMESGKFVFEGEILPKAETAPLTDGELAACFRKTDGLPLAPEISVTAEGAFLPKSALNALRRRFYAALCDVLDPPRPALRALPVPVIEPEPEKAERRAVIGGEKGDADVLVVKPKDYSRLPAGGEGVYLYLPPLFTSEDEALVAPYLKNYEGIYCEGTYGIPLAKKYGVSLFAGTGFNLTNRYAVAGVKEAGARYFALSKELSAKEQKALAAQGAFSLSEGAVKVMDLCYCPFQETCAQCDRREVYTLTDEAGRRFPLRRYEMNGCRFEVYNCAPLHAKGGGGVLEDGTVSVGAPPTAGHSERSMR